MGSSATGSVLLIYLQEIRYVMIVIQTALAITSNRIPVVAFSLSTSPSQSFRKELAVFRLEIEPLLGKIAFCAVELFFNDNNAHP